MKMNIDLGHAILLGAWAQRHFNMHEEPKIAVVELNYDPLRPDKMDPFAPTTVTDRSGGEDTVKVEPVMVAKQMFIVGYSEKLNVLVIEDIPGYINYDRILLRH